MDFESFGLEIARFQSIVANSLKAPDISAWTMNYGNLAAQLKSNAESFSAMLKRSNFQALLVDLQRNTPYNFLDLMIREQLDLIEISKNSRFGTVEILPKQVIHGLLGADRDVLVVNEILLDGSVEIIEMCQEVSEALIDEPLFRSYGVLFDKATEAFKEGHFEASQALSTNLWDTYLCEKVGRDKMISKAKQIAPKPDIEQLEDFSPIYAYASYAPAIASYEADPMLHDYSRNATVHHISTKSANVLNSIKSLTVCGGVLARNWRLAPISEPKETQ
jgi:hypothetical protein